MDSTLASIVREARCLPRGRAFEHRFALTTNGATERSAVNDFGLFSAGKMPQDVQDSPMLKLATSFRLGNLPHEGRLTMTGGKDHTQLNVNLELR